MICRIYFSMENIVSAVYRTFQTFRHVVPKITNFSCDQMKQLGRSLVGGSLCLLLLQACGGNSTERGVFLDSPVEGLQYRTDSQQGFTDVQGAFEYKTGESVVFSLGEIEFPPVPGQSLVTPIELTRSDDIDSPEVVNILRLLQTLDVDQDPENGIQIPEVAQERIQAPTISFSGMVDIDSVILEAAVRTYGEEREIVPAEQAVDHLLDTLSRRAGDFRTSNWDDENLYLVQEGITLEAGELFDESRLSIRETEFELKLGEVTQTGTTEKKQGIYELQTSGKRQFFTPGLGENGQRLGCLANRPSPINECENVGQVYRVFLTLAAAKNFSEKPVIETAESQNTGEVAEPDFQEAQAGGETDVDSSSNQGAVTETVAAVETETVSEAEAVTEAEAAVEVEAVAETETGTDTETDSVTESDTTAANPAIPNPEDLFPACSEAVVDENGDGYGWENGESCYFTNVPDNTDAVGQNSEETPDIVLTATTNCPASPLQASVAFSVEAVEPAGCAWTSFNGSAWDWGNSDFDHATNTVTDNVGVTHSGQFEHSCTDSASGSVVRVTASCEVTVNALPGIDDITDLFFLTGQSNAAGLETAFNATLDAPDEQIFAFTDIGWQVADLRQFWEPDLPGNHSLAVPDREPYNNIAFQVAKSIVAKSDRVVGVVMLTAPGQGISHWDYNSEFFIEMRSKALEALNALPNKDSFDGLLWLQGESDWLLEGSADPGATGFSDKESDFYRNYYPNKLFQLISNFRSESWFGSEGKFVCAETKKAELNPHLLALNLDEDVFTGCAAAADLETRESDPFGTHFSASSLRILGSRIADIYLEMVSGN